MERCGRRVAAGILSDTGTSLSNSCQGERADGGPTAKELPDLLSANEQMEGLLGRGDHADEKGEMNKRLPSIKQALCP